MKNYSRRPRAGRIVVALALLGLGLGGAAGTEADNSKTFRNPILTGSHPDPSVCRVGGDFYLVTSSFEYFPALPVFHSRDLVSWQQIGHVLDRPSQIALDKVNPSDGVYAGTIRYHDGTFYVITTLVSRQSRPRYINFIVTAKNPAGPWSEPIVLSERFWRIHPSLFFDNDGKTYMTANRTADPAPYSGHRYLTLQELDLATMTLVGPVHDIGEGAARFAPAPESPHLYKKGDYYYLMAAEGGTFDTHAVTMSRSKSITGPYELDPSNPILTHRQFGQGLDIHGVGHADLVDTPAGDWWMVALGMRGVDDYCCNLGRETFLTPVKWDSDGWPVVNPGVGRILTIERRPALPVFDVPVPTACDHFDGKRLDLQWNFIRTPHEIFWSMTKHRGYLRMDLKKETLNDLANPAFIGRRIQDADFTVRTRMEFRPNGDTDVAGLALRNGNHHIRMVKGSKGGVQVLSVISHGPGPEKILAEATVPPGGIFLKIEGHRETTFIFSYATEPEQWTVMKAKADGTILGHQSAPGGQFTGAYVGMYATSQGVASTATVDYDWFEYRAN